MTVNTVLDSSRKEELFPLWIRRLVELGQFYRNCESHRSNVCNLYCRSCMGLAICPECRNQHIDCGQKILTAYKASGVAAFRTEDMRGVWDISGINIYSINKQPIVFIQKKGGDGHVGFSHCDERCRNCSYRITSPCEYCSIECKVEVIRRKAEADRKSADANIKDGKRNSGEEADAGRKYAADSTDKADEGESNAPKSYRKRPRKGIPHRAPFF